MKPYCEPKTAMTGKTETLVMTKNGEQIALINSFKAKIVLLKKKLIHSILLYCLHIFVVMTDILKPWKHCKL